MKRRDLLVGAGVTLALPFIARPAIAADVDVVIVGAGAAGLSAARVFMDKGVSFKLVEAKNRIGGRAITDTETFGTPFDMGCAFLHHSSKNPWVTYAENNGFTVARVPDSSTEKYWKGDREFTRSQYKSAIKKWEEIVAAVSKAGEAGRDVSMAEAAKGLSATKWDPMVNNWMANGRTPEEASVMDWWNGADGKDKHCPEGFGTLVAHFGRDIPVELGVSVQKVDLSGTGVLVETDQGTIRAKQCIVTVSNGVLAAEKIQFVPALDRRMAIVEGIPMVQYMTVGLKLDRRNVLPTKRDAYFHLLTDDDVNLMGHGDFGGSGVLRVNFSGQTATELERAGKQAAIDFTVTELRKALGTSCVSDPLQAAVSMWGQDP